MSDDREEIGRYELENGSELLVLAATDDDGDPGAIFSFLAGTSVTSFYVNSETLAQLGGTLVGYTIRRAFENVFKDPGSDPEVEPDIGGD